MLGAFHQATGAGGLDQGEDSLHDRADPSGVDVRPRLEPQLVAERLLEKRGTRSDELWRMGLELKSVVRRRHPTAIRRDRPWKRSGERASSA